MASATNEPGLKRNMHNLSHGQRNSAFRVGLTRDFLNPDGSLGFGDIGLDLLDGADGVDWEFLRYNSLELVAEQIHDYDALMVLGPRVTAETFAGVERLSLVARFGVGYDNVDVEACTQSGVALTITPEGVRRPVATSVLTLLLALSHKLLVKDRLTREGRWSERLNHMGRGLTKRTLGVIGLGNIGREVFRLAAPLSMRHLATDPHVKLQAVADESVALVDLDTLLRESDFVVVCCALNEETHHLLNAERLALMKSTAYLINVARGPIIDQRALTAALLESKIAGAGLDVFEQEPVELDDPILKLDNVILTPHALCWTDECFLGNGTSAIGSILDVAAGRVPQYVVNPQVIDLPSFQKKLRHYAGEKD